MRRFVIVGLIVVVCCCGCGRRDLKQIADKRTQELFGKYQKSEAIPFFEKAGKFFDAESTTTVDRDVILPMLKHLKEAAHTDQWVLLRPGKQGIAIGLFIELPGSAETVNRMAEVVEKADDDYSGFIVQQWGREWLGMALVDRKVYEIMKKSNPKIDQQRQRH